MAATLPPLTRHPIPRRDVAFRGQILFLHPGYEAPRNKLLSLSRVDYAVAAPATFGVHHNTALLACQIVADNTFNGYLTSDREGQQRVDVPLDGILTETEYYFTVGNGLEKYPIVPSFDDWEFPHNKIPDFWPEIPFSFSATSDISRCGVTNFSYSIEDAHLVPKEEADWYSRNGMDRYGSGLGDIDNKANLLPLKSDIHKCFDKRWFVIVPKVAGAVVGPQYATHILSRDAAELCPTYHNTRVKYLREGSLPYLFARFAWAVLILVKPFVTNGSPRHVIRVHVSTDADGEEKIEREKKLLNGPQLMDFYGGGGSKSATSKKRKSKPGSAVDDDDSLMESSSEGGEEGSTGLWDVDVMDVWEERGRKASERAPENLPLPADEDMSEAWEERGSKGRQQTSEAAPEILPLPADEDMSETFSEVKMTLRLK